SEAEAGQGTATRSGSNIWAGPVGVTITSSTMAVRTRGARTSGAFGVQARQVMATRAGSKVLDGPAGATVTASMTAPSKARRHCTSPASPASRRAVVDAGQPARGTEWT